jgi:DNA-binding CsgD family transcriptional regulator
MLTLIENHAPVARSIREPVAAALVPTDRDRVAGDPELAGMLDAVRALIGVGSIAARLVAGSGDLGELLAGVGPEPDLTGWRPGHAERLGHGAAGLWLPGPAGEGDTHLSLLRPRARDRIVLVCRARRGGGGDRRQLEQRIASFLPLIERTVGQWARAHVGELRLREQGAVFDALGSGLIVVDADCRIHQINAAARAQIEELGVLSAGGDRLAIRHLDDAVRFQVVLRQVLDADGIPRAATITALRRNRASPVLLAISALPRSGAGARRAAVQIIDPQAELALPLDTLARHWDLTQAEGRLVEQLARGRTLAEAAVALRLKEQTARTYLKHIFQKTGLCRQVELIRLVLAGAVPVLRAG